MRLRFLPIIAGLSLAVLFTALAQDGPGPEPPRPGGGAPGGNAFSIQYRSGSSFGGTGPGNAGQVLTSNGAGSFPTFQTPTAGGVTSVNGETGVVVLDAADVGAVDLTDVGVADGVASLDSGGQVPLGQLPFSGMTFNGLWNADDNIPMLEDGTGVAGDFYRVSVAGTQDLGNGPISFQEGDAVLYDGALWQRLVSNEAVQSVNGQTGVVELTATDVGAVEVSGDNSVVYGTDGSGDEATIPYATAATASTLVMRDGDGTFAVPTPANDSDAANKAYVDSVGGSGTPGGMDTEVQFNDMGSFAGDPTFTFDGSTVTVPDLTITGTCTGCGGGGGGIDPSTTLYFEDDFIVYTAMNGGMVATLSVGQFYPAYVVGSPTVALPFLGAAGHPGIAALNTGDTATGAVSLYASVGHTSSAYGGSILPNATNPIIVDCVVQMATVPSSTQSFIGACGLADRAHPSVNVSSSILGRAIYSSGDSEARWELFLESEDADSSTVAAVGPTAGAWHHMRLTILTTSVVMEIDGTEILNVDTGIPDESMGPVVWVQKLTGTTNRAFNVDYIRVQQTLPARLSP